MFVFVNVKQSYQIGEDPKPCALGPWVSTTLLKDDDVRNHFRLLVAYANKRILGIYQIIGIGEVIANRSLNLRRKVFFEVSNLPSNIELELIARLQALIDENNRSIIDNQHIRLLELHELQVEGGPLNEFTQKINLETVSILEPRYWDERNITEVPVQLKPKNLWYKITLEYHSFSSFRTPVMIDTISKITLGPSGKIQFDKMSNQSGVMVQVEKKLSQLDKSQIVRVFNIFEDSPSRLYEMLNNSDIMKHIAHSSPIKITIQSFNDSEQLVQIQRMDWEGDVSFSRHGILNVLLDVMVY